MVWFRRRLEGATPRHEGIGAAGSALVVVMSALLPSLVVAGPGSLSTWVARAAVDTWTGSRAPWTEREIEAARQQGACAEVLERASDVSPSERTDGWRAAVDECAAKVIEQAKPGEKARLSVVKHAAELAARYPFLEKSPRFPAAHHDAIVKALLACREKRDQTCVEALDAHTKKLSGRSALEGAKAVRRTGPAWAPSTLIRQAVETERALCKEPLVQEVVVAALGTPADYTAAKDARTTAFDLCWEALVSGLKKGMIGASGYYLENACASMREKKALSSLHDELCKERDH